MSLIVDDTTVASTPGEIIISKAKYLDYQDLKGIGRIYYLFLLGFSDTLLYKRFKNNLIVFGWLYTKEQFKCGCINPTVVIDKNKGLIATFTNLTSVGDKPTPVIKISIEKLHLIKNMTISNGQRLATVALYERGRDPYAKAWTNFDPKIPNCFTDNIELCNMAIKRLSKNAWKCLDKGLEQLPDNRQPGLYPVQLDSSLVNNAY